MPPPILFHGIEPDCPRIDAKDALHPQAARFLVPMLDAAAGIGDLVGAHGRITDEDDFVVGRVGVQHLPGRDRVRAPTDVVLPHPFVRAVVEVEIFQMLEFGPRGGKQFLHHPHMRVHGPAHIQK